LLKFWFRVKEESVRVCKNAFRVSFSAGVISIDPKCTLSLESTSHFNHTINCEAVAYEFSGINFIFCKKMGEGCNCFTPGSLGTHSSLDLTFINDTCEAFVDLISVMPDSDAVFKLKSGWIKIDKELYKQNILKAKFDFKFSDKARPNRPIEWNGLILTKIEGG
jgi:hypothetical protein